MFSRLKRLIKIFVSLYGGTDFKGTIAGIRKNAVIKGVNIWMLICSALLACIGLDTNSTAVIIGAMLISPLMSPILGVGLAVGIQERRLLYSSLKNLGLATFISLSTSVIYFFISPLAQPTAELTARITPTILDVGVAFFGGVAGIVAGSRKDKTNAIPGVAIATALMPPLCTAGFGLATMQTDYFYGAFYLYFINAFFISFATYLIVLLLRFPRYVRKETDGDPHIKTGIIVFAILVIIPSGIIFYNVLAKLRFDRNVKSFVSEELRQENRQPIDWQISDSSDGKTLKVFVVGRPFTETERQALNKNLAEKYRLRDVRLNLIPLNLSPEEIEKAASAVETNLTEKMSLIQSVEERHSRELEDLRTEIEILRANTEREKFSLPDLVKSFFPSVKEVFVEIPTAENNETAQAKTIVSIIFQNDVSEETKKETSAKIERVARLKLKTENVEVKEIVETQPETVPAN